jgi:hypothetical protein
MNRSIRQAVILTFLMLAPSLKKGWADTPRIPTGIYAVVPVDKVVGDWYVREPLVPPISFLDAYLRTLYTGLLNNEAVAGLALQIQWDTLNPLEPKDPKNPDDPNYSWNYVQDAFDSVHQWNRANPGNTKTIQLEVSPGFFTPLWVLDKLTSCDDLFKSSSTAKSDCGRVTFRDVKECGNNVGCNLSTDTKCSDPNCYVLPLPWDPTYKADWTNFLKALNAKFGSDSYFVSIAVAGPTAASTEMILPNDHDADVPPKFSAAGVDDMWNTLLKHHNHGTLPDYPDDVFVNEWNAVIDTYGAVFKELTLVVTTGNGLPELPPAVEAPTSSSSSISYTSLRETDCKNASTTAPPGSTGTQHMDCLAEVKILYHFVDPSVGGNNGKATQTSGVEADRVEEYLGIDGVRYLTKSTMTNQSASTLILGGGQFNTRFSIPDKTAVEGGITPTPNPTKEQAAYNALSFFFNDTPAAQPSLASGGTGLWSFSGTRGMAPLNYLQIYYEDIQYGTANNMNNQSLVQCDLGAEGWSKPCPALGTPPVSLSAQTLLVGARNLLLAISQTEP